MARGAPEPVPLPHPRETPDLIGHDHAEALLSAAFRSGRLPHAWLVGGPAGVGKTTLAYRFARYLLAAETVTGASADPEADLSVPETSAVFRQVAAASHPDLLGIERPIDPKQGRRTGDLPVDQVRRIAPFLHLTASGGGWRIVVVDDADRMNRNSANAILKILEEPPRRTVLILVSDQPGALLPTLRSRCRRLKLSPVPEPRILELLERRMPDLRPDERIVLARLAEGAPGRALSLAAAGGHAVYTDLLERLRQLPSLDWVAVHALGDRVAATGAETLYRQVSDQLQGILQRIVRLVATGQLEHEVMPGERLCLTDLAGMANLDRWLQVWDNTGRLFRRADQANLDRKQTILAAFNELRAAL